MGQTSATDTTNNHYYDIVHDDDGEQSGLSVHFCWTDKHERS